MLVDSSETIKSFIDSKIFELCGKKSDKIVLINIGRQLNL